MKTNFDRTLPIKILLVIFLASMSLVLLRPLVASKGNDKVQPKSMAAEKSSPTQPTDLGKRIDSVIDENGAAR